MPVKSNAKLVTPATSGLVSSVVSLNPEVKQVYPIVNSVYEQMTGQSAIQAVDTNSLVAMGQTLENLGKKDIWLNTLNKRIGKTIDGYRIYDNHFKDLYKDEITWGAYVQKLYCEMPEAKLDKAYDVGQMDGQSVDQWIINNPDVEQKFFESETPYSFFITIQDAFLNEAFLSSFAMNGFIKYIFGAVKNKLELTLEELARMCVANYIINVKPQQQFHLVTMYNDTLPSVPVTTQTALADSDFLRWAIGMINTLCDFMENYSVSFNSEGKMRFTPARLQRLYLLAPFIGRAKTVVQYAAFNEKYVSVKPDNVVPYWQATKNANNQNFKFETLSQIQGTNVSGTQVTLNNVVGILFDRDAMGTFKQEEQVRTTPVNARALYYNTFWHCRQFWFNDLSENGIVFFLD